MFTNSKDEKNISLGSPSNEIYPTPSHIGYTISDFSYNSDAQIPSSNIFYPSIYKTINSQQHNTVYSDPFYEGMLNQVQDDIQQYQYQQYHAAAQNAAYAPPFFNNHCVDYETTTNIAFSSSNDNGTVCSTVPMFTNSTGYYASAAASKPRSQSRTSFSPQVVKEHQVKTKTEVDAKMSQKSQVKNEPCETNAKRGRLTAYHHQLPDSAVESLNKWFETHIGHPYPTAEEKLELSLKCDISVKQVNSWFCNRRNRSQNTKPKRIKRQLEQEMTSILSELASNRPLAIQKLRNTLAMHDIEINNF